MPGNDAGAAANCFTVKEGEATGEVTTGAVGDVDGDAADAEAEADAEADGDDAEGDDAEGEGDAAKGEADVLAVGAPMVSTASARPALISEVDTTAPTPSASAERPICAKVTSPMSSPAPAGVSGPLSQPGEACLVL